MAHFVLAKNNNKPENQTTINRRLFLAKCQSLHVNAIKCSIVSASRNRQSSVVDYFGCFLLCCCVLVFMGHKLVGQVKTFFVRCFMQSCWLRWKLKDVPNLRKRVSVDLIEVKKLKNTQNKNFDKLLAKKMYYVHLSGFMLFTFLSQNKKLL